MSNCKALILLILSTGAVQAAVPWGDVDINGNPRAGTLGAAEPVSAGPPPSILPLTDANGFRSQFIRVVRRSSDAVDPAWATLIYTMPNVCDVTLTNANDMGDLASAVNNTGNNAVCLQRGANLGTGLANITRSSCSSTIWILQDDYATVDPADLTVAVYNDAENDKARIGQVQLSGTGNCMFAFYRVKFSSVSTAGVQKALSCTTGPNNFLVSHSESGGTITNIGCGSTRYSAHYVVWKGIAPEAGTNRNCFEFGADESGTWLSHSELRDCPGHSVYGEGPMTMDTPNNVAESNDFAVTSNSYTDCQGTLDNGVGGGLCSVTGSAVYLEGGASGGVRPILISRNRIRGYRASDSLAGAPAGSSAVFSLGSHVLAKRNVVWDSHHALKTEAEGIAHSLNSNSISLRKFDVVSAGVSCLPGGHIDCSGFNVGWDLEKFQDSEANFNLMVWDQGSQSVNWTKLGSFPTQMLGNVLVRGDSATGSPEAGSNIDCNAYENTASLGDANGYVGTVQRLAYNHWIDHLTDPRVVSIPGAYVPPSEPNISGLCSGIPANPAFGVGDPELN